MMNSAFSTLSDNTGALSTAPFVNVISIGVSERVSGPKRRHWSSRIDFHWQVQTSLPWRLVMPLCGLTKR